MRADARDLERYFKGNGDEFEEFICDLVRAAARSSGISQNEIDWDTRPSVRDGGRDIVVRAGNPLGPGHFIPDRPSLWSVKSGADGVDPVKLGKEILEQQRRDHPKVREALRAGQVFIWCAVHPASNDQRDEMRKAARAIERQLGVSPNLIDFRWQDRLVEETNRFPSVIAVRMPDVEGRWSGVRTLSEWQREPGLNTPWREFGTRAALVARVANHLLARGAPNVLHIAGLSGIGKTRTVLESCTSRNELSGVLYLPNSTILSLTLERALRETELVFVVIDETRLDEIDTIAARFADCADRVRIVTIGPASRQSTTAGRDIVIVPEPESEDDILNVIRPHAHELSDAVLRSVAAHAAHDLRLALMLVRASLRDPELRTIPIVDFKGVWARIMRLFESEILDPNLYRQRYEALTVAIDVGVEGEVRPELQSLGIYFGQAEGELLDCLNVATNCGLGLRAGRFFEAIPHALALGLFSSLFGRQLRDRLQDFMSSLPPRLLRRFLERCQECPGDIREEVAARVGGVFLGWLGPHDVTRLVVREASRIFQAWAEFDPVRGLAWLRRAVESATPEQLLALDGETDGSGGWRGRRQLVWLCQNLASFTEHFRDCEAILFRFARHENEEIGNNSTAVWKSLFWPVLAHTEVPFADRFPILLDRLSRARPDDLLLVLNAAFQCLAPQLTGLPTPPRVVGGRIVPTPWMPETIAQWRELRWTFATKVLTAIALLPQELRGLALREVIRHLRLFRELGLTEEAKGLFSPEELTNELRLALVVELDQEIEFNRSQEREEGRPVNPEIPRLESWRGELAPRDLAMRVQDITARVSYDAWGDEGPDAFFAGVAEDLIGSPETFRILAEWFDSPQAKAIEYLGFSVGKRDTSDCLADHVRAWLQADRCRQVTIPYLNGAAARGSILPSRWASELDSLAVTRPELMIMATMVADVSARGFERVVRSFDRTPAVASRLLRAFGYSGWPKELTIEQQLRILEILVRLAETGDTLASHVGVDLLRFWCHFSKRGLDSRLVPPAFTLVERAPASVEAETGYNWWEMLRLLCPYDPVRVAELVVDVMTSTSSHPWRFGKENVKVLREAARLAPDGVMEVVGLAILDRNRRAIFGIDVYHGLFETIGVHALKRWVDDHGQEHLRWIARHFGSPALEPTGQVVIPPLTHWLFTEREDDQRAFEWFLMGRHSGARMWSGNQLPRKREEMEPFRQHPLRRVQEWAAYEIQFTEREDERFRQLEDESERL